MDFSLTQEQEAVRDLARQIFSDHSNDARVAQLDASEEWHDDRLWKELARANLSALALPEDVGGSGLGILETCLVFEEVGRHLAHVPLLATLVLGGMPIAEFGTPEQRQRWLRPVTKNESVLTAALQETASFEPLAPRVTATRDGSGWRLDGTKICVPAAHLASAILVPARIVGSAHGKSPVDSIAVFVLENNAPGVTLETQTATNHEPLGQLELEGAPVAHGAMLGSPDSGPTIIAWIVERTQLALAATQVGIVEEAMRRTAVYVSDRKQFGRAIGSFQSAQHRIANAYIDVECTRSVVIEAAWRLAENLPAAPQVKAAKWWSCVAGDRVTHTAQHLHGGIGADVDYPIHRFFLWSQHTLITLGGPRQQLAQLGAELVRSYHPEE